MSMIPAALLRRIGTIIARNGDDASIDDIQRVSGGCIHHTNRIETRYASYFLKWNEKPKPDMFTTEAKGLQLIGETNSVRVPQVFEAANRTGGCPAFILMEWIEPPQGRLSRFDPAILGGQLAQLHKNSSKFGKKKFGLDENNYIGEIAQINSWNDSWIDFFRENRLAPQVEIASRRNLLPGRRRDGLLFIMDHLDGYIGDREVHPGLLHGDLWAGNVIPASNGQPVLLDPAVYYGDRETDLAFSELFSGFGSQFYAAYEERYPIEPGYQERKLIYNLYHLINHLNHFGEMYGGQIDVILRSFVK